MDNDSTKIKSNLSCSFCASSEKDVNFLIEGDNAYICDICIDKANEIVGTVKQALEIIEKEKQSKQPKVIEKPKAIIEEKPQQIIRQSSEKTIQRLEPIQERTPLYSDLRRERIEKHNSKMTSIFRSAFN